MDPLDLVPLARTLVDIDSTTGVEGDAAAGSPPTSARGAIASRSSRSSDGRFNVLATLGAAARSRFSTHFDCVPPFFPEPGGGRTPLRPRRLRRQGHPRRAGHGGRAAPRGGRRRDVALLFVVGEERGSDGARAGQRGAERVPVPGERRADRQPARRGHPRRLPREARGTGRAAHSSYPEAGESAIEKLLDALNRLRAAELPSHPLLGRTHYTVGLISGGIAPNVIPPHAEAEVMFRTVGPASALAPAIDALGDLVAPATLLEVPAVELTVVPGFETAVFPFTTDIPFLDRWGRPFLIGPGSIFVAHTDHEHVELSELEAAVDKYAQLGRTLAR